MRQLRGEDARFVYGESGHANSNITLISIYDPSTARDGRVHFKELLKHIESRLHLSPIFRQKLLRVPMELDFPYWIEDDDFDLEYHVRHIALPKPGDWRQFCIQASRIHARPLDLSKPLWELYLVEGLDSFLALHFDGHRKNLPFVVVSDVMDCAGLVYHTKVRPRASAGHAMLASANAMT